MERAQDSPKVTKLNLYDAVLENDKLKTSDKILLFAYLNHANEKNGWTARPSLERIRRLTSLSERTLRRCIGEFRNGKGFLTVLKEGKRPSAKGKSLARVCQINVDVILRGCSTVRAPVPVPAEQPELLDRDLNFLDGLYIPGYDQDPKKVTLPQHGGPAKCAPEGGRSGQIAPRSGIGPAKCAPQPVKELNRQKSVLAKAKERKKERAFFKKEQQGRESKEQERQEQRTKAPALGVCAITTALAKCEVLEIEVVRQTPPSLAEADTFITSPALDPRPRWIREVTVKDLFKFVMKPQPGEDLGSNEILFQWMRRRTEETPGRHWLDPTGEMKKKMLADEHDEFFPEGTLRRAWNFYLTLNDSHREVRKYICQGFVGCYETEKRKAVFGLWDKMDDVLGELAGEWGRQRMEREREKRLPGLPPEMQGKLKAPEDDDSIIGAWKAAGCPLPRWEDEKGGRQRIEEQRSRYLSGVQPELEGTLVRIGRRSPDDDLEVFGSEQ